MSPLVSFRAIKRDAKGALTHHVDAAPHPTGDGYAHDLDHDGLAQRAYEHEHAQAFAPDAHADADADADADRAAPGPRPEPASRPDRAASRTPTPALSASASSSSLSLSTPAPTPDGAAMATATMTMAPAHMLHAPHQHQQHQHHPQQQHLAHSSLQQQQQHQQQYYPSHSVMEDSDAESEDEHEAIEHEIAATQQYYANQGLQYAIQQQQGGAYGGHGEEEDEDEAYSDDGSSTASIPDENIDFSLIYALHTFLATVEGQASVVKGDSLLLLDDANSYWWLVRVLKTEDVGYIPAENVETPYERLARLNKHRNIEVALATLDDKAAHAAGGARSEGTKVARVGGVAGGLLGWKGRKTDGGAARRVIFAPPTYVEHPGVTWSSDEESDEEGDEVEGEGEGLGEGEEEGDEGEPDDGVEWAEDVVEERRMAAGAAAQAGPDRDVRQAGEPHAQRPDAERGEPVARDYGRDPTGVAAAAGGPSDDWAEPRAPTPMHAPVATGPPATVVTPATPSLSDAGGGSTAPARPARVDAAGAPRALSASTTSARRLPRAMRFTDDFDFSLVVALSRARALATRLAPPASASAGSLAPSASGSLAPRPPSLHGAPARPAPPADTVQAALYGARAEMDAVAPEIRGCFATLCARLDAWDREADELLGALGVVGAMGVGKPGPGIAAAVGAAP